MYSLSLLPLLLAACADDDAPLTTRIHVTTDIQTVAHSVGGVRFRFEVRHLCPKGRIGDYGVPGKLSRQPLAVSH